MTVHDKVAGVWSFTETFSARTEGKEPEKKFKLLWVRPNHDWFAC